MTKQSISVNTIRSHRARCGIALQRWGRRSAMDFSVDSAPTTACARTSEKNASVTVACSIQLSIHQYSLFISFEGCQIQKLVLNPKEDSCYDAMKVACVKKE